MRKGRRCQFNPQAKPWLLAGLTMSCIYQLLTHLELPVLRSGVPALLLCFWEGIGLGLMLMSLLLCKPERAEAIRAWKKAHFPALFR